MHPLTVLNQPLSCCKVQSACVAAYIWIRLQTLIKKECLSSLNLKGPAFSQDLEILVRSDEIPTVIWHLKWQVDLLNKYTNYIRGFTGTSLALACLHYNNRQVVCHTVGLRHNEHIRFTHYRFFFLMNFCGLCNITIISVLILRKTMSAKHRSSLF